MEPRIDIDQAYDILTRLQSAAPPNTAARLAQVMTLLTQLSEENNYLNSLVLDPLNPGSHVIPAEADEDYVDYVNTMQADVYPEEEGAFEYEPAAPESTDDTNNASGAQHIDIPLAGLDDALRPALVAIRGRAELVQDGLLGQVTTEQDMWLQAILENTNRAFSVLDAIQEMLSIQTGNIRVRPVNFLSTDLLSEAWERTRDRAKALGHTVTIQAPDVVPLAHADFYESLIILTDLLDNAIYYTPPQTGQIKLSVDNLGTHVLFSVADNGIGLRPEDMENIGKAFWRGTHHKLVRAHSGTGLRLYLAKQMLALQNGELIFTGEVGMGSTFSFTLPAPE